MQCNDKYSSTYQIGRALGTPIFKNIFKPIIINEDFIPKEGPVILAGNHLHVWDQCPVMCSTKRTIHWMAKKEYFEGNLRLMYKYMGCIPVDRFGNADDSKNMALDYLNHGNVIGIFPEGTRNHVKERNLSELTINFNDEEKNNLCDKLLKSKLHLSEILLLKKLLESGKISKQDFINYIYFANALPCELLENCVITEYEYYDALLLPFKFGAVSMAKKTNAIIVPFGVTGEYVINNGNLTVEFGNPISIENKNLEDANIELRDSVKNIVKRHLKK